MNGIILKNNRGKFVWLNISQIDWIEEVNENALSIWMNNGDGVFMEMGLHELLMEIGELTEMKGKYKTKIKTMEPITIREILETKVFIVLCKCGAENKATLQNPTFNCKGCNKVIGKPDLKKQ